ncbi:MarR family transcriptional regulator [Secundilactobacillus paracollinoides]|uniref:HTH-type transcriptional regulator SarZ n=1 Tax=Secundilactobacillus paracollinoides TaxID=240427 RepID=A0A1B2IVF8_9LACO|nr:MarR family transcriptional regulator [Secundilactobacillus paracollinoides]ANZ60235.1 MarR family transcriptional regulator [Secundilactobacillus paracollinoides]ANZ62809.1 MarR family transcriptional regulator [Secundilactobacillus paracollinoides]ANZ66030.1 MarR family transcriptional regulator [Secundilactobacillus paracollinoides]KRL76745.1 transcription regulator [Secundilactobacillus paracollinoides DSM 15502 = JCM 11969]
MNDDIQLTNLLCFSVYNMNRLFNKFYQQALAPLGLTYAQYLVLMSLWEHDNQTLHELGDELKLSSNTLTPLLKRLEKNGWLTRVRPENDRRQLIVSLTDKGNDEQDAIFEALADCIANYHLSPEQYKQALALNNDLISAFETGLDN